MGGFQVLHSLPNQDRTTFGSFIFVDRVVAAVFPLGKRIFHWQTSPRNAIAIKKVVSS